MRWWRSITEKYPLLEARSKRQVRAHQQGFCHEMLTQIWFLRLFMGTVVAMGLVVVVTDLVLKLRWNQEVSPFSMIEILSIVGQVGGTYIAPILIAFNAVAVITVHQRHHASARLRNRLGRPYFCHQCGYDLRRSRTAMCPECGWAIEIQPKRPRERWRVVRGRRIARFIFALSLVGMAGMVVWAGWLIVEALRTW